MTKNLKTIVLQGVEHQVTGREYEALIGSCFPFYGPQPWDKLSVKNVTQPEDTTVRNEEGLEANSGLVYRVPRMTEDPRNSYGLLKMWLIRFHKENEMNLPRGFYKRDKIQLRGMFEGMMSNPRYGITIDRILGEV
jgi:hypothetical protein